MHPYRSLQPLIIDIHLGWIPAPQTISTSCDYWNPSRRPIWGIKFNCPIEPRQIQARRGSNICLEAIDGCACCYGHKSMLFMLMMRIDHLLPRYMRRSKNGRTGLTYLPILCIISLLTSTAGISGIFYTVEIILLRVKRQ